MIETKRLSIPLRMKHDEIRISGIKLRLWTFNSFEDETGSSWGIRFWIHHWTFNSFEDETGYIVPVGANPLIDTFNSFEDETDGKSRKFLTDSRLAFNSFEDETSLVPVRIVGRSFESSFNSFEDETPPEMWDLP